MKKPVAKEQSEKPEKQKVHEYTLAAFMKMNLPKASEMVDKRLGDAFIGPFTKRYNQLAATYNVRFPQLQPAFRKLDLLLASQDRALIDAAARMKDLTVQKVLESKTVETIPAAPHSNLSHGGFELATAAGWENFPDGPGDEDFAGPGSGSGAANRRASGVPQLMALSHCHETIRIAHGVWIPELAVVFEKLNRLLARTSSVSETKMPPDMPGSG